MKVTINVDQDGKQRSIKCSPLALIGWERTTKRKLSQLQSGGMGLEDLAIMGYEQEKLAHQTEAKSVEEWLDGVEDINPEVEDPTSPDAAASDES
jgi:hypothetical protein